MATTRESSSASHGCVLRYDGSEDEAEVTKTRDPVPRNLLERFEALGDGVPSATLRVPFCRDTWGM